MAKSLPDYLCIDYEMLHQSQLPLLQLLLKRVYANSSFYKDKLKAAGIKPEDVQSLADFSHIPFTVKEELREHPIEYLRAAAEEDIVRIHASSGTTGKPTIIPYTKNDVNAFAEMMSRCLRFAGIKKRDRVQITPGYGLWTAGIGFQSGVERIGAMAIPMGPGNTEKQLEMMLELKATVLIGTASYGLFLAEEIAKRNLMDRISLRTGVFGSERWGEKMRQRISSLLKIDTFDIYGLTEIYGPGIGIDCHHHRGIHYWNDYLYFEIIDPDSGKVLPVGEKGELVITTLTKEGLPLVRYRTRDVTRLLPEVCSCGSSYPMIDRILGRSDEAFKVKGVMVFPGQIDAALKETPGASSEYQVILSRQQGRDCIQLRVEGEQGADPAAVSSACRQNIKRVIGILADIEVVPQGSLPRSEKKTKRIFDRRVV
ncbi:MAG: phenylacetate--CoA ligase [Syntrophomonadaceae bacterium]|jgi:phenylacetate-CoA ligase|nr:phenylacetate--CoA ligase [Syntrophomonadaceae bacterium]HAF16730.1 phenylacetate--CoA ligase [Peptococcaceae bacterium]